MLFAIALTAVLVQQPQAANRPPLTGTWVGETERLQVTLKGDSLTLTQGSQDPMTYRLDGSVSRNTTKTAAGTQWKHESVARWVGNAVLIVTKTTRETGASWEWLAVYSIDQESGGLTALTVDYSHEGGDGMLTRSRIYRRASGG